MESFKRFILGALDRGGVLQLVFGCLALYLHEYIPSVLGPVSVGLIAVGVFLFGKYIITVFVPTNEDVYQELLHDFERFSKKGEHHTSEDHREHCFRFLSMREYEEAWRSGPSRVGDRITDLERLLQAVVEISSCASRTLDTLRYMRARQRLSSGTQSEEDIAILNNVDDEDQTDEGNMQQKEQQTQQEDEGEKITEIPLEVEPLSEEVVQKILAMKVAKEVLKKLIADKARRQEIFKNVYEAEKRGLQEETAEEVLGEEAAGEVQAKKMVKTTSAKVIAKGVLKEVAADNDLMQEIVKIVLKEATEDLPGVEVVRKLTLEEVVEEVLKDGNLIEDVLEQIFVNISRTGLEIKEEEKLETVKKMLETELVEEVTEKEAAQKMPVQKVSDEMLEARYQRENTSAETIRFEQSDPEQEEEEKQKIPVKLKGILKYRKS